MMGCDKHDEHKPILSGHAKAWARSDSTVKKTGYQPLERCRVASKTNYTDICGPGLKKANLFVQ